MIFIFPWPSIIVYQLRHFALRIHHLTITSGSCAPRRHREPHLRIIPKAPCLFSLQEMCLHHSCNRELNPSLDQFLKHVLSRLRQGRCLWVLLVGILGSSFVPPWHLYRPSMQTPPWNWRGHLIVTLVALNALLIWEPHCVEPSHVSKRVLRLMRLSLQRLSPYSFVTLMT